jgi:hypothetical protein
MKSFLLRLNVTKGSADGARDFAPDEETYYLAHLEVLGEETSGVSPRRLHLC